MKIALVRTDIRDVETHQPDMPLGLLHIASYLEKFDYEPEVYDLNKQDMPDWSQFDVIGFSMLPLARKQAWGLIKEIKQLNPKIRIVLGGVFPSSIPNFLIKNLDIDAIVVGEGEASFLELIQFWDKQGLDKSIPKEIDGLCTKEHGSHKRRALLDINDIPAPAWHHSNFDWFSMTFADNQPDFVCNGLTLSKERLAMVSMTRGCINFMKPCYFCQSAQFWGNKYRIKSSAKVLEEIEDLYYNHGVRVFAFNDDSFPVNKKQCLEFCKGIIDRGMQIAWKSDTRGDCVDEEMIFWMKKSGCFMIAIGIESANAGIRKLMHKNLNLTRAKRTVALLKKYNILAYTLLMVGNVGETEETLRETRAFLQEVKPDYATWVTGVMICADTELYDISKKQGLIDDSFWLTPEDGMRIYTGEYTRPELTKLSGILEGWRDE